MTEDVFVNTDLIGFVGDYSAATLTWNTIHDAILSHACMMLACNFHSLLSSPEVVEIISKVDNVLSVICTVSFELRIIF